MSFDYKTERSLDEDHVPVFWKIVQLSSYKDSGLVYILSHCHGIICLTSDDCGAIVMNFQSRNRPSHQLPFVMNFQVTFLLAVCKCYLRY